MAAGPGLEGPRGRDLRRREKRGKMGCERVEGQRFGGGEPWCPQAGGRRRGGSVYLPFPLQVSIHLEQDAASHSAIKTALQALGLSTQVQTPQQLLAARERACPPVVDAESRSAGVPSATDRASPSAARI